MPEMTYVKGLSAIEQLWRKLVQGQVKSAQDLWKIETRLLDVLIDFQRQAEECSKRKEEIQASIVEEARSRCAGWKARVALLRREFEIAEQTRTPLSSLHTMGRRFGDALAWILLGPEQRQLLPLSENKQLPWITTGKTLKGLLSIAQELASKGVGFPLLHDVTSALRIGDVTFVKPGEPPFTIEVKTRELGRSEGVQHLQISVYAVGNESSKNRFRMVFDDSPEKTVDCENEATKPEQRVRRKPSAQLSRQMQRMYRASLLQSASDLEIVRFPGEDQMHISLTV